MKDKEKEEQGMEETEKKKKEDNIEKKDDKEEQDEREDKNEEEEEEEEKEESKEEEKKVKNGEREDVYARRRRRLEMVCAAYGDRLRAPLRKYNGRLRYETAHGFMYCENYKIGSTAWAAQVLAINGVNITAGEAKGTLP